MNRHHRIAGIFALIAALTLAMQNPHVNAEITPIPADNIVFITNREADGRGEIYAMGPDGLNVRPISDYSLSEFNPRKSPDGTKIAFSWPYESSADVYAMNADGTGLTQLTVAPENDYMGDWSPDGSKITFTAHRPGTTYVAVMDSDGSNLVFLTPGAATVSDGNPSWSPDGTKIAFNSYRDGNGEIYVMNADGSDQTRLTGTVQDESEPKWSPDSSKIAFRSARDGNWEIYVMDADGSNQQRLTRNPAHDWLPAWSPDGEKIAFASLRDGNWEIYVMNSDGTGQTNITNHPAADWYPDWASSAPPSVTGPYDIDEGDIWTGEVRFATGTGNVTVTWDDGSPDTSYLYAMSPQTVNHLYQDDRQHTLSDVFNIVATVAGVDSDPFPVIVRNVSPVVEGWNCTDEPVLVGTPATCRADFSDAGVLDAHYGVFDWEPGANVFAVETNGSGFVQGSHTYTEPGVYPVSVTVWDDDLGMDISAIDFVVVYDPAAGFATGGGWFVPGKTENSDPDDILPGLDGTSGANFGFVVKYQNGQSTTPEGQLEFQYKVGGLNLHSLDYEWLVLTNDNWAKFQGTATINGDGEFPFKVEARDGQNGQPDRFVIRVWDANGGLLYKASGDLGGGNIKIHN